MQFLVTEQDLKNRKFFHKPIHHETGRVLPNAGFVKGIIEDCDCAPCMNKKQVRYAHVEQTCA